jgi:hypothetical protein
MTPLDIAVPWRYPKKSPKNGINVWRNSRQATSGRLLGQCYSHPLQGSIDVAGQAIPQKAIGTGTQKEYGDRQKAGIPEGQTGTDGARLHGLFRFEDIADAAYSVEQLRLTLGLDFLA